MRIAILSDIHANCFALDAALADVQRTPVDQMVCLGDAIQGGAQPAETVQRQRELGCAFCRHNAGALGAWRVAFPLAPASGRQNAGSTGSRQ